MGLINWSEKKIHKLTVLDFSLAKVVWIIAGMVIGAYISTFVKQYVWCFIAVFIVLYAILLYKVFKKKS